MARLCLVFLLTMSAAACGETSERSPGGEMVTIPEVSGQRLADGAATLQAAGLCVLVEQGTGYHPQEIVVEQRPHAGSVVEMGTLVTIVIDTPADVNATMEVIGTGNETLGCTEGSGIGPPAVGTT